jgi:hypothetical protein
MQRKMLMWKLKTVEKAALRNCDVKVTRRDRADQVTATATSLALRGH